MKLFELQRKIKRLIKREIFEPLLAPYFTPEYERLYGKSRDRILSPVFAPFRKWRSKRIFQQHLRPTDIFLVGHPKSGNTWLAYLLAIIIGEDFNNHINLATIGDHVPAIHGRDSKIADYKNLNAPRVFRNEYPIYLESYPRTIYLIRDPRAILLSYYHMYNTIFENTRMAIEAFVNEYLSCGCIKSWEVIERWDKQVDYWVDRANKVDQIMLVKYEDMVYDRGAVLKEIVNFFKIPCTKEIFDLAVNRGSFNSMQNNEKKHGAESYIKTIGQKGRFIRKGKTDEWKSAMDQSIIEQIETELGLTMKKTGYL
jgi:hypothetical protein